jgi:hypothetical protein
MKHPLQSVVLLLVVAIDIALPLGMVWGWIRWARQKRPWTPCSILSLISMTLATASGLLAFCSLVYAHAIGGFPFYDPLLLRIYRWGGSLSLAGIAFAISGVWRPSPLRWHAPACSAGMFFFWFVAAMGE